MTYKYENHIKSACCQNLSWLLHIEVLLIILSMLSWQCRTFQQVFLWEKLNQITESQTELYLILKIKGFLLRFKLQVIRKEGIDY